MRVFIYLPLSEDAGFYAYMAKAVANGAVLHRDITVSTHSSYIYLNALFFKFFESSVFLYRVLAIIPEIILASTLSVWLQKRYGLFLTTICITTFVVILNNPHVTLDVGRNNHLLAIALLWGAIYFLLIKRVPSALIAGVLLGLAVTVREPYVLYGLPLLWIAFERKVARNYFLGGVLVAIIWSIFLLIEGQLSQYLKDILFSGSKFRYGVDGIGFFDPRRIISNVKALEHGAKNFYGVFLFLAFLIYVFKSKDYVINAFKFLLLPMSLFIEICVNKSTEYSIQPIMFFITVLLAEFLNILKDIIKSTVVKMPSSDYPNILLFTIFIGFSWSFLVANWNQYSAYIEVSKNNKKNALSDSIPLRGLAVINQIPHESIATTSEYPLLFLSKQKYPNLYPFVEDLTAGINSGRDDITRAQIELLGTDRVDIIVIKTSTEFTNAPSAISESIKNYKLIAEFSKPTQNPVVAPYGERIYLSKDLIKNQFISTEIQGNTINNSIEVKGVSLVKLTNIDLCSFTAYTDSNPRISSQSIKGSLYIWTSGAREIKYQQNGNCNTMEISRLQLKNVKN
jgi:hypothetical protein